MVISVLIDINQHEKNCVVQQKHQLTSIDAKYTVHYKTHHLISKVMEKS